MAARMSSSALCSLWKSGKCSHGMSCKFSHGETAAVLESGTSDRLHVQALLDFDNLRTWKNLLPQPKLAQDAVTVKYLRMALSLIESGVVLAEQVIKDMATDRRLHIIRDVLEGLTLDKAPWQTLSLWEARVLPLLSTITHSTIVDSALLQQDIAIIYRTLLGHDATRLKLLFDFILRLVDQLSGSSSDDSKSHGLRVLSVGCRVLVKTIDTSSANIVNAHFASIVANIQAKLDIFGNQEGREGEFYASHAAKKLDYVRRRLSVGESLPNASRPEPTSGVITEFTLRDDLPGALSSLSLRHDNDHIDIADIKLLPTHQEIKSCREEHLPDSKSSREWRMPLSGLLDRSFRLLREDTLYEMRNIIRAKIEDNNVDISAARMKVNVYKQVTVADVTFHRWSGLEFVIRLQQPQDASTLSKSERANWWAQSKRLREGLCVCIVDDAGKVFFFQVSRSINQEHPNCRLDDRGRDKDKPEYSLTDDNKHAYLYLKLAKTDSEGLRHALCWYKAIGSRQQQQLLEFPTVFLPAFAPPLEALQCMSKSLDMPFQDILTLDFYQVVPDIAPPLYSARPGFVFDLRCLTNKNIDLHHSVNDRLDPATLSNNSTLDSTQSEAILNSLTRSFALIQGPPGSGKGYTGEALIKVLVANQRKGSLGPIICVCSTHDALDQRLGHLVDAGVPNVMKIGSRTKSTKLAAINLRDIAKGATRTNAENQYHHRLMSSLEDGIKLCRAELSAYKSFSAEGFLIHSLSPDQINELIKWSMTKDGKNKTDKHDHNTDTKDGVGATCNDKHNSADEWLRFGSKAGEPACEVEGMNEKMLSEKRHLELVTYNQKKKRLQEKAAELALDGSLEKLSAAYRVWEEKLGIYDCARRSIDQRCMQEATVIGIASAELAMNLDTLRDLQSKVLLCEEAGEILEPHLLTALLPSIEHAILIGDHSQLRPQTQDWRLQNANPAGLKYSLDVSLFERLTLPSVPGTPSLPFSVLGTQRRMHPAVSALLRSTSYPSLTDSSVVMDYPEVPGMQKRLFWLHHENAETSTGDATGSQYTNQYEVDMVSALVSHLLRQGTYGQGDIAVLTPYSEQLNELRQKLGSSMQIVPSTRASGKNGARSSALDFVRAATVDNFRGQEAKVVIISLVRSNSDHRCGFLSTPNWVNFLLSRAMHGMYIIGNSLPFYHVPAWEKVITLLERDGNIGRKLELQCPRHPKTQSTVSISGDLVLSAPDGGCSLPCDLRLECGHSCTGPCHSDLLHSALKCLKDCTKPKKGCDHPCNKGCGEPCDEKCLEVLRDVGIKLDCGHTLDTVECWKTQDKAAIVCNVEVEKEVPGCGHKVTVACHVDISAEGYSCTAKCGFQHPCGHTCSMACSFCRTREAGVEMKAHTTPCQSPCGRTFKSCGHRCLQLCHGRGNCKPCSAPCQNQCSHSKCVKQCHEPCLPCAEDTCSSCCPHSKCNMPCAAPCDWVPCTKRCTKILQCTHQCPSVCGELCPDTRYCQQCATQEIKDRVVDLIMMETYGSIDLDKDPCIFPDCGHIFTWSTMDGQMGLKDFYTISEDGLPVAVLDEAHTFIPSGAIKVCPSCRGSLRNIARYGRLVRRGILDESTRKFIAWAHDEWQSLSLSLTKIQKRPGLRSNHLHQIHPESGESFDLTGKRDDQVTKALERTALPREIERFRSRVVEYSRRVSRQEQPYERVAQLVRHANHRHGTKNRFVYDETAIQMGKYIEACATSLECDSRVIFRYLTLCRGSDQDGAKSAKIDSAPYTQDCEQLIKEAAAIHHHRQMVRIHILASRFCAVATPPRDSLSPSSTPQGMEEQKWRKAGLEHLRLAKQIMDDHPSTAGFMSDYNRLWKALHGDGL